MLQVRWFDSAGIMRTNNYTQPVMAVNWAEQLRKSGVEALIFVK